MASSLYDYSQLGSVLNSLGGIKLGNARVFLMGESWEVPGMCTEYSGHFVTEYSSAVGTTVHVHP